MVNGIRLVDPGSVSNPPPGDLRASYALIEADPSGYTVQHRRVDYDREAAAVQRSRHPAGDYIIRFLNGRVTPAWTRT